MQRYLTPIIASVFFVLVPRLAWVSPWGEWFTLGWPFPMLALKLGYMSPESPRGPHFQLDPTLLCNALVWFVAFYGLRRLVRAGLCSRGLALGVAILAFVVGGVWFSFGLAQVIHVLILQSQS